MIMTIFDSIKYPLDDVPTTDQVMALPNEITDPWTKTCQTQFTRECVRLGLMTYMEYPPAVALLRKIIMEYDSDNL